MSIINRYVKYKITGDLEPNLIGAGDLVNHYKYHRELTAKRNKVGTLTSKKTTDYYNHILTELQLQGKTHISKKDIDAILLATSQLFMEQIIFENAEAIHVPFIGYFIVKQRKFKYKPYYLKLKFEYNYGELFRNVIRAAKETAFRIPRIIINRNRHLLSARIKDYLIEHDLIDNDYHPPAVGTDDTLIIE